MFKSIDTSYAEWLVSAVMLFSIGCVFGASHPEIPLLLWVALIFAGACAKIWLHHCRAKAAQQQKHNPPSHVNGNGAGLK